MSEYAELLTELTALPALAKSEAPAPAEAPAAETPAPEAPVEGEAEAKVEETEADKTEEVVEVEGDVVAKSEIPDGFVDATEVVEALRAEVATLTKSLTDLAELVKVVAPLTKSLHGTIADQDGLIKSMQADLVKLGNAGQGRKAVLAAPRAPEAPKPITGGDVMAKALEAQKAGKITGRDVSTIVALSNRGMSIPEDLARQIGAL